MFEPKLSPRLRQNRAANGEINLSIDGMFHIGRLGKSQHGRWVFFPASSQYLEAVILQSIASGLMQLNGHGVDAAGE